VRGLGIALSFWLLFGALLLGVPSPAAQAQDAPPDLPTYETWLREAFAAAQRGDRLGLEQIAPRLIETSTIRSADGTPLPVDNGWLEDALQEDTPDLPRIAQRLGAVIETLSHPNAEVPDDSQQRLQEMLNNPPFAQPEDQEADSGNNLLTRFVEWLFRQLDRLFGGTGEGEMGAVSVRLLGWLLTAISVLILVGAAIYFIAHMRRSLTSEAHLNANDDDEVNISATAAFQQASTLARDGDYRTAMRYLYLSALLWLDERNLLRYDRALTNREYLERLHDNPDLRAHLAPIVDTFDRVWYGYGALDADDFARYQKQVEDLRKRF
jgi:hypothetical protein